MPAAAQRRRRRPNWRNRGVATRVNIKGQRVPVHVERPTLHVTRERGTNVHLSEVEGGTQRLVVSAGEGHGSGGRGPVPREPERIDFNAIREQLQAAKQERAELIQKMLGGGAAHGAFRQGLKSTREGFVKGVWSTFFPSKITHFWNFHPVAGTAEAIRRARYSKVGSTAIGLRAKGGFFTSRKREQRRADRYAPLRESAAAGFNAALNEFNRTVDRALTELERNQSNEGLHRCQQAVEAAERAFSKKRADIETAFKKALRAQKLESTKGEKGVDPTKGLHRI